MTLREQIEADGQGLFLNSDEFAEQVTYYPRGGGSRTIKANVDREGASVLNQDGTVSYVYMVHVANDLLLGIAGNELDTGGDRLGFPPKDGETAVVKSIYRVLDTDMGMHYLECR